jgi:hypothetical protein
MWEGKEELVCWGEIMGESVGCGEDSALLIDVVHTLVAWVH